ncbi:MAG: inositol-3-phosphate synthase [Ginsengibacter sp.]
MEEKIFPAKRAGVSSVLQWLSFCLKSPRTLSGLSSGHGVFTQLMKLQNILKHAMEEDRIIHIGQNFYQESIETL